MGSSLAYINCSCVSTIDSEATELLLVYSLNSETSRTKNSSETEGEDAPDDESIIEFLADRRSFDGKQFISETPTVQK